MPVPRSDLLTRKIRWKKGTSMDNLIDTFCDVDYFCNVFIPEWETRLIEDRSRTPKSFKATLPAKIDLFAFNNIEANGLSQI